MGNARLWALIATFVGHAVVLRCDLKAHRRENMAANAVDESVTIESAVTSAMRSAGVDESSPIKQALIHDAQVYDLTEVCVPDPDGKSVSLADRLLQMRLEPRWRSEFPEKKPTPSSGRPVSRMTAGTGTLSVDRENFAAIANGTVRVE